MGSETCKHDWTPMAGGEVCYGCNHIRRYDSVTYTAPVPFAAPTPPQGRETTRDYSCGWCGGPLDPSEFATPTPPADGLTETQRLAIALMGDCWLARSLTTPEQFRDHYIEYGRQEAEAALRATPAPTADGDEMLAFAEEVARGSVAVSRQNVAGLAAAYLALRTPTPTADGEADLITPSMVARAAGATDCSPSAMAEHLSGQFRALRARPLPEDVQAVVEQHRMALTLASSVGMSRDDIEISCNELLAHIQRGTP